MLMPMVVMGLGIHSNQRCHGTVSWALWYSLSLRHPLVTLWHMVGVTRSDVSHAFIFYSKDQKTKHLVCLKATQLGVTQEM